MVVTARVSARGLGFASGAGLGLALCIVMAECDLVELVPDAKCYLCLSAKQLAAVIAGLLCKILQELDPMASCELCDVLADAQKYLALDNHQIGAVQLSLLCQISQTAGELGASGVHIDTVDPVADPGVDSQIWINRTSGDVWYWNDDTGVWVLLIT